MTHNVFITGATGYMGSRLAAILVGRGHTVRCLVRPGSEDKLPQSCEAVLGDALKKESFAAKVAPSDTFVQLLGVAHPSPAKAKQFREIDLVSAKASIEAAAAAGVKHFIYVSVAHPAPAMHAYIAVRSECEEVLRGTGMNATILRPWYVLGPGHYWPYLLLPFYWLAELFPASREGARRLGLVTLEQMLAALVCAVETPANGVRVVEVPEIRQAVTG